MQQGIGQGVGGHDEEDDHRHLEKLGDMAALDRADQPPGGGQSHRARHRDAQRHMAECHRQRVRGVEDDGEFEGQHRRQGAHRVIEDRFPTQDFPRTSLEAGLAQQGNDDGGAGDDQDAAKHRGRCPGQPTDVVTRQGRQQPDQRAAEEHQALHRKLRALQPCQVQRQATLEQDHRHGDRDQRFEQLAEYRAWVEYTGYRADEYAAQQQQDDGRHLPAPGQPLGADTERRDQAEDENGGHEGLPCGPIGAVSALLARLAR